MNRLFLFFALFFSLTADAQVWYNVSDSHVSRSDSVVISQGIAIIPHDAATVLDAYSEGHIYYDGSKIRAAFLGQTLDFRVSFWVKRLVPNAQISYKIDIGTATTPINITESAVALQSHSEWQFITESVPLYALSTFLQNGASVQISASGDIAVHSVNYLITSDESSIFSKHIQGRQYISSTTNYGPSYAYGYNIHNFNQNYGTNLESIARQANGLRVDRDAELKKISGWFYSNSATTGAVTLTIMAQKKTHSSNSVVNRILHTETIIIPNTSNQFLDVEVSANTIEKDEIVLLLFRKENGGTTYLYLQDIKLDFNKK